MSSRQGSSNPEDNSILILVLVIVGFLAATMLYDRFRAPINGVAVWIVSHLLALLGLVFEEPRLVARHLIAKPPEAYTLENILAQFSYLGSWLRWPLAAVLIGLAIRTWGLTASDRLRRRFDLWRLLQHNVDNFPCIAPAVNRFRSIDKEPYDTGYWRTARQPVQFALEHQLLLREGKPVASGEILAKTGLPNPKAEILRKNVAVSLDWAACREIFIGQIGTRFISPEALPDHQRGLAAAFLAFGHGDKTSAQELLDRMSLSFREKTTGQAASWTWKPPFLRKGWSARRDWGLDITGADELLKKWQTEEYLAAVAPHTAFVSTWFVALLEFARRKGILPPAQFIWLKPRDRTLWYTLQQVGGRTPWAEAAGPWNHFQAEVELGEPIEEPEVTEAVSGLELALFEDGWLPEIRRAAGGPRWGKGAK